MFVVVVVCHRRAEKPVRPLLGEPAGLAERDRHGRDADLGFGETIGDDSGSHTVKLEHRGPAVLDHQRGPAESREVREEVAELARGEGRDEVGEALAPDGSDDLTSRR